MRFVKRKEIPTGNPINMRNTAPPMSNNKVNHHSI
jgi:hypothetical protein